MGGVQKETFGTDNNGEKKNGYYRKPRRGVLSLLQDQRELGILDWSCKKTVSPLGVGGGCKMLVRKGGTKSLLKRMWGSVVAGANGTPGKATPGGWNMGG